MTKDPKDKNVQSEPDNDKRGEKAESQAPDPYDPAHLQLPQDFGSTLGVKKALRTVPVRKPPREWWVQVHPAPEYRLETAVLELKEEGEIYLVDPSLLSELGTDGIVSPKAIFTAMNRQGVLFLWPVRMPRADGRSDEWSRSALEGAAKARGNWIRISANMPLGAYEVWETSAEIPEPDWPEMQFQEILRIAFKDHYIDSMDHKVLRELRGEA